MRIQTRVFLTILLSSIVLVAGMVLLMRWSIDRGLIDYVNARQRSDFQPLATELERLYQVDRWVRIRDNPALFDQIVKDNTNLDDQGPRRRPPPPPRRERRDGDDRRPPPPPRDRDDRGDLGPEGPPHPVSIVDTDRRHVAGRRQQPFDTSSKIALNVDGEIVGWLLLPRTERLTEDFDIAFQTQQTETFFAIGAIVVVLAGAFAFVFAPTITRPIRQLAEMANQLSSKNYDLPPISARRDEIGALSRDIHELGATLKRNEQVRQRWFADTSHELRTPVSIIRGEIEAMLDGVRELTPENLDSVKQEVLQLQKLIEDLADLSNADIGSLRYQKEVLDLSELAESNASHYQQLAEEAGLGFRFDYSASPVEVYADRGRMQQLIANLIQNSCKYTDAPGEARLSVACTDDRAVITVEDTAPAVPAESLPQLFDYLYRVESSRNRRTGGAGLGLAIAQRIVEAHEGEIVALPSALGGLKIVVRLPLEP